MTFSPSAISRLKQAIDLKAEAEARGIALRKSGNSYVGLCPFHKEDTPSLRIHREYFHCFGCQASGDAITFVLRMDSISFTEAVRKLADQYNIPLDGQQPSRRERNYMADLAPRVDLFMARRRAMLEDALADAVAEQDDDFAETVGSLLRRLDDLHPGARASLYLEASSQADREEYAEHDQSLDWFRENIESVVAAVTQ